MYLLVTLNSIKKIQVKQIKRKKIQQFRSAIVSSQIYHSHEENLLCQCERLNPAHKHSRSTDPMFQQEPTKNSAYFNI